jgi:hypothetical protein
LLTHQKKTECPYRKVLPASLPNIVSTFSLGTALDVTIASGKDSVHHTAPVEERRAEGTSRQSGITNFLEMGHEPGFVSLSKYEPMLVSE